MASTTAALYVHLPFCPYICPYCDFAKWRFEERGAAAYLHALHAEIDAVADVRGTTVFFGGGTPNAYRAADIDAILAHLRRHFGMTDGGEVTLEANPDRALTGDFAGLVRAGVNRLSIGVQSFVEPELRALGRQHSADDVRAAVARARAAGIHNISLDLMFGTPHQTLASWDASLDAALALDVEHLSTYGLTIEAGTPYATWYAREPGAFASEELEADLYARTIERLTAAGYEHYEISNFARPGKRCAHNATYWRNDPYIGLGVGAASYRDGERFVHTRDLATYVRTASAGEPIPSEREALAGLQQLGEAIMLALRTAEGVDIAVFRERYRADVRTLYDRVIRDYVEAGLLEADEHRIALSARGRFVANDVCGAFLA